MKHLIITLSLGARVKMEGFATDEESMVWYVTSKKEANKTLIIAKKTTTIELDKQMIYV